jgi:hypothetical protein
MELGEVNRRAEGLLQKDGAVIDCRQLGGHTESRLPNSRGGSRHGPAGVAILAKRQRRSASPLRDRSEAIESRLADSFPALNTIFASVRTARFTPESIGHTPAKSASPDIRGSRRYGARNGERNNR